MKLESSLKIFTLHCLPTLNEDQISDEFIESKLTVL